MYFVVTEKKTSQPLVMAQSTVLMVKKDDNDMLTTVILTGIIGGNGSLRAFAVEESVEEVGRRILSCIRWNMAKQPEVDLAEVGFGRCGGQNSSQPSTAIISQ